MAFFSNISVEARLQNWWKLLYDKISNEDLSLACCLLDHLWPDGRICGPAEIESWLSAAGTAAGSVGGALQNKEDVVAAVSHMTHRIGAKDY